MFNFSNSTCYTCKVKYKDGKIQSKHPGLQEWAMDRDWVDLPVSHRYSSVLFFFWLPNNAFLFKYSNEKIKLIWNSKSEDTKTFHNAHFILHSSEQMYNNSNILIDTKYYRLLIHMLINVQYISSLVNHRLSILFLREFGPSPLKNWL